MHSLLHDIPRFLILFLDELFLIVNQMLSIRAFGRRVKCNWRTAFQPKQSKPTRKLLLRCDKWSFEEPINPTLVSLPAIYYNFQLLSGLLDPVAQSVAS